MEETISGERLASLKELQDPPAVEQIRWHAKWKVEKFHGDLTPELRKDLRPYEVVEGKGNLLLNVGIDELFTILCSASSGTKFDNTNAQIGVGNSNTAAAASQTDLQGGSTAYVGMEASYPTYGSSQKATFQASFGSAVGNFAWEEWIVDNDAVAGGIALNRKVTSLGTKVSGTTWLFTVEISLS